MGQPNILAQMAARSNKGESEPPTLPTPPISSGAFAREFVRVQFDKLLLFALIILLHHFGEEKMFDAACGGLILLIQGQRFKL